MKTYFYFRLTLALICFTAVDIALTLALRIFVFLLTGKKRDLRLLAAALTSLIFTLA